MKWVFLMAAVIALAGSSGLLYLGALHNSQQEFVAEGGGWHVGHAAIFLAGNFLILWVLASLPILWFYLHSRFVLKR